jgi:hypothetical protein
VPVEHRWFVLAVALILVYGLQALNAAISGDSANYSTYGSWKYFIFKK